MIDRITQRTVLEAVKIYLKDTSSPAREGWGKSWVRHTSMLVRRNGYGASLGYLISTATPLLGDAERELCLRLILGETSMGTKKLYKAAKALCDDIDHDRTTTRMALRRFDFAFAKLEGEVRQVIK